MIPSRSFAWACVSISLSVCVHFRIDYVTSSNDLCACHTKILKWCDCCCSTNIALVFIVYFSIEANSAHIGIYFECMMPVLHIIPFRMKCAVQCFSIQCHFIISNKFLPSVERNNAFVSIEIDFRLDAHCRMNARFDWIHLLCSFRSEKIAFVCYEGYARFVLFSVKLWMQFEFFSLSLSLFIIKLCHLFSIKMKFIRIPLVPILNFSICPTN